MKKILISFMALILLFGLVSCLSASDKTKVNECIEKIDNLPPVTEFSKADFDKWNEAYECYMALSDELKELVTNAGQIAVYETAYEILLRDEKINECIALIDEIPTVDKFLTSSDHSDKIASARKAYDALDNNSQSQVLNYNHLLEVEEKVEKLKEAETSLELIKTAAKAVVDLIANIKVESLYDQIIVATARAAYEALTEEAKQYVSNLEALKKAEALIAELQQAASDASQAEAIDRIIEALPEVNELTLNDKSMVTTAKDQYDLLTESAKKYVKKVDKLNDAVAKIEELEEAASNMEKAEPVIKLIKAIPSIIDNNAKSAIDAARSAYNKLSTSVKTYVTNYADLEKAEKAYQDYLDYEKNLSLAKPVIEKIAQLPKEVDASTIDLINECTALFDALPASAQKLVTNQSDLAAATLNYFLYSSTHTDEVAAYPVEKLIATTPIPSKTSDIAKVYEARNAYEALSDSAKAKVKNYNRLLELEEAVSKLEIEPFTVWYELNNGSLPSASYGELVNSVYTEVTKVSLGIYNIDFFANSDKAACLYDKTFMSSQSSTFAYNIFIGIKKDNNNEYVVKLIQPSGTGSTASDRSAYDYYIVCNAAVDAPYSALQKVSLGDTVTFSSMPTKAGNVNITAEFNRVNRTSRTGFYNQYIGVTTLCNPVREGYAFLGWYNNKRFEGEPMKTVYEDVTLYAKWERDTSNVQTDNIIDLISDVVDSDTIDHLPKENNEANFTWTSSNPNLYQISNEEGHAVMMNQTHKKQTVNVSVKIDYKAGGSKTLNKEIIINPVKFKELPANPIATYFNVGAASSYRTYSTRYQKEQTYFSENALNTLNIVYYAFLVPSPDGSVSLSSGSTFGPILHELRAHNIRVVVSIDGANQSSADAFYELAKPENSAKLATFAKNVMAVVEKYNFDGIDIDWEYTQKSPITKDAYSRVMKALDKELRSHEDEGRTPYMMTAAIPSYCWGEETKRFDFNEMNQYLDYINIMSYDSNSSSYASHVCPLYASSYDNAYKIGGDYGVNNYSSKGFPASKLLIGCAGYGKAYKVSGKGSNANYPGLGASASLTQIAAFAGKGSYASGTAYGNVVKALENTAGYKKYTEINSSGQIVGSYLYNETEKIFVTYESAEELAAKWKYISKVEGLGLMCWAHNEDTADIYIDTIAKLKNK